MVFRTSNKYQSEKRSGKKPKSQKKKVTKMSSVHPGPKRSRMDPGVADLAANVKKVLINESKVDRGNQGGAIGAAMTKMADADTMEIIVPINPWLVAQYIYGIIMRPLEISDNVVELSTARQIFAGIAWAFPSLQDNLGDIALPRPIVELRAALMPRRIRNVSYVPDWQPYTLWAADIKANGFTGTNWHSTGYAQLAPNPTNDASGFVITPTFISYDLIGSHLNWGRFFSTYSSYFDLVPVQDFKDKRGDASAFAFDINPSNNVTTSTPQQSAMVVMASGYDRAGAPIYLRQTSVVGLETPIRRPWLAALRIGTPSAKFISTDNNANYPRVNPPRNPGQGWYNSKTKCIEQCVLPVSAPNSLLGWNSSRDHRFEGSLQLKVVPGTSILQDICNRIENMMFAAGQLDTTLLAAWTASFTANQIRLLCFFILRNYMKTFSGAWCGALIGVPSGSNVLPGFPEYHAYTQVSCSIKIPEMLAKALGSLQPTVSKKGALFPIMAAVNPSTVTPTMTYTATGQPGTTIPANEINFANFDISVLAARWRLLEYRMAQASNLSNQGELGPSLLDTTVLVAPSTSNIVGFQSRRPIDDAFMNYIAQNVIYVSYDFADDSLGVSTLGDPGSAGQSLSNASHEYRQSHSRYFGSLVSIATLGAQSNNDGFVRNGFTSNVLDNSGTNRAVTTGQDSLPPLARPQASTYISIPSKYSSITKEAPNDQASFISKLASRIIPRSGNYCGPGWTAGVDTFNSETLITKDGQYIVSPTSQEDAICKAHDEAYRSAKNDPAKVKAADLEMVRALDRLAMDQGLSWYAHGARTAIRLKALDRLDELDDLVIV